MMFFLFNGYGALPDCIFNSCWKINPDIVCYRFEDGMGSCCREYDKKKSSFRIKVEGVAHKLFHTMDITEKIKGYYFSEP